MKIDRNSKKKHFPILTGNPISRSSHILGLFFTLTDRSTVQVALHSLGNGPAWRDTSGFVITFVARTTV